MNAQSNNSNAVPIETHLRQIGFPFTRDSSGNYEISVGIAGGRSQLAVIDAKIQPVDGGDVIRISSVAYACDGLISEGIANSLLAMNSTTTLGAWCIQLDKGHNRFAAYVAKIALGNSADLLRFALLEVADMADDIESKLSGVDQF